MIKTFKVKLHPTKEQEKKMYQSAGAARWAYNWTLGRQVENGKFTSDNELRKEITQLKKTDEFSWLSTVSAQVPKQAVKDGCGAFKKFFREKKGFPKFKSRKRDSPSFYNDGCKLKVTENTCCLEMIGRVKLAEAYKIPYSKDTKYLNPRIKHDGLNWYITVSVELCGIIETKISSEPIGIDLGIKDLAIVSNGLVFKNINKQKRIKKLKKRLKRQQRKASKLYEKIKKKEGVTKSFGLMKLERQIRKTYKTITNVRVNHIHQMTSELVKNKPEFIVIESLNIKGMMKNKHLSRAVQEQKLHEVIRQIRYKSDWYGVKLIEANRWFPSSKTCSHCGYIHRGLKLKDRQFNCPCCELSIDRDYNASINLRDYGSKLIA